MDKLYIVKLMRWFFKGYIGQRILIFLAPFLMPASEFHQKNSHFAHLHIPYLAPTIGIVFLYGAFLVLLSTLKHHGFDFTWLIQIDNWGSKTKLFLCLFAVIHAAPVARFWAPFFLKLMNMGEEDKQPSFAFWSSYYGGVAMVLGTFSWIIVLLVGLQLSWLSSLIAILILISLITVARLELKRRQMEFHVHQSFEENTMRSRFEVIIFTLLSSIALIIIALA